MSAANLLRYNPVSKMGRDVKSDPPGLSRASARVFWRIPAWFFAALVASAQAAQAPATAVSPPPTWTVEGDGEAPGFAAIVAPAAPAQCHRKKHNCAARLKRQPWMGKSMRSMSRGRGFRNVASTE